MQEQSRNLTTEFTTHSLVPNVGYLPEILVVFAFMSATQKYTIILNVDSHLNLFYLGNIKQIFLEGKE